MTMMLKKVTELNREAKATMRIVKESASNDLYDSMNTRERKKGESCKRYSEQLFNLENDEDELAKIHCTEGPTNMINREQIEKALKKMENGTINQTKADIEGMELRQI